MQRFFTDFQKQGERIIVEEKRVVHQLAHVLRAKTGERIMLLDNSGREYVVELGEIVEFGEAMRNATGETKYIGLEREIPPPRGGRHGGGDGDLKGGESFMFDLFIGPEGGWTESEQKLASEYGILPVHLPNTVLRTETAAVALSALFLYHETWSMKYGALNVSG